MNRSARNYRLKWAWILCAVILLPACSNDSSTLRAEVADDDPAGTAVADRQPAGSRPDRSGRSAPLTVIPVSHQFAPPPLPKPDREVGDPQSPRRLSDPPGRFAPPPLPVAEPESEAAERWLREQAAVRRRPKGDVSPDAASRDRAGRRLPEVTGCALDGFNTAPTPRDVVPRDAVPRRTEFDRQFLPPPPVPDVGHGLLERTLPPTSTGKTDRAPGSEPAERDREAARGGKQGAAPGSNREVCPRGAHSTPQEIAPHDTARTVEPGQEPYQEAANVQPPRRLPPVDSEQSPSTASCFVAFPAEQPAATGVSESNDELPSAPRASAQLPADELPIEPTLPALEGPLGAAAATPEDRVTADSPRMASAGDAQTTDRSHAARPSNAPPSVARGEMTASSPRSAQLPLFQLPPVNERASTVMSAPAMSTRVEHPDRPTDEAVRPRAAVPSGATSNAAAASLSSGGPRGSAFPIQMGVDLARGRAGDKQLAQRSEFEGSHRPAREDGAWVPVDVPLASLRASQPDLQRRADVTQEVVARRVLSLSRKAEDLASRGAYYAARAEMIKALRVITQALDSQQGGMEHSESLARAMRAFSEAADFAPRGSQLEAELNLQQVISGHRTPVLHDVTVEHLPPLTAQQRYLEYAQEQFAMSCGDLPVASYALYGLARIYTVMEHARLDSQTLCLPKAVTLHQAALLVDANNARAANELGVLLARFGQLQDARRVLLHALSIRPEKEIWMNLAVVHQRLGESELAQQAQQQGILMARRQVDTASPPAPAAIQWVDPQTFSALRPGPGQ